MTFDPKDIIITVVSSIFFAAFNLCLNRFLPKTSQEVSFLKKLSELDKESAEGSSLVNPR
jgi:hypothetical protein